MLLINSDYTIEWRRIGIRFWLHLLTFQMIRFLALVRNCTVFRTRGVPFIYTSKVVEIHFLSKLTKFNEKSNYYLNGYLRLIVV